MNYLESLVYLESLSPTTQTPCLERVAAFLEESGRPHDRFASLHVGGTNGKGSTVAMLDQVLRRTGKKIGRFTGPHLLRWNERFHVDGRPITDYSFSDLATRLRRQSEDFGRRHPQFGPLTWFEFLTAMAFFHFAENHVEIAVVEVGLGGRWDATNVLASPLATAITNVDLDHTHILGETIREIAREKAGIVKAGRPVVTAATGEALAEILSTAHTCASPVFHCQSPGVISLPEPSTVSGLDMEFSPSDLLEIRDGLSLAGSHQQLNALVALAVLCLSGLARCLPGDRAALVADELGSVYWPGRLQFLPERMLVLDGAHNPSGAVALRTALDEQFPDKRCLFVVGCFQNKDVPAFIRALLGPGDRVIACEAASRRAVFPAEQIAEVCGSSGIWCRAQSSVSAALSQALEARQADEVIVASGSFATVREVMLELGWRTVEDGYASTLMNWSRVLSARR